ncbi:hypothetical protein Tco_1328462 [Tanacetum coccineum]
MSCSELNAFYKLGLQLFLEFFSEYHGRTSVSDRVFDFPEDELESHPVYDFFAPALLLGYASNPNNNNGWLAADDYLLGELEAMVNEQMVVPAIEEISEPVVEAEEDQVIALVIDMEEGQMDALMMDIEDDLAALLVDDDFEDDASDGFGEEEVWEVNEDWLMAPTTPPPMLAIDVQQRNTQIQQLQTTITEMSSRESTLMRCILGLERWIAALERRPPGSQ